MSEPSKREAPAVPRETSPRGYRYGDFPELFWDLLPEEPVDLHHPVILTRILMDPSGKNAREKLLTLDALRRGLPHADLPEHARLFWTRVLEVASSGPPASAPGSHA